MLTELQDIKSRANYISNYFEIRDAQTRQLLISTHTNNLEGEKFNDVIDQYVNDATFKVLEVRIGNNQGDSKKQTYYLQAAGYEGESNNILELLPQKLQPGITINGIGVNSKNPQAVEDLIESRMAAFEAKQAQQKLEDNFLFLSKELDLKKEFLDKEFKLKQQAKDIEKKLLQEELNKEKEARAKEQEERALFREIGKGALEGLAGLAQMFLSGNSNNNPLSGLKNNQVEDKPTEEKKLPKKSPISFNIVNQDTPVKPEAKKETKEASENEEIVNLLNGLDPTKKELVLKVIKESKDEDFVEDLEGFLEEDPENEEEATTEDIEEVQVTELDSNGQH